VEFFSVGQVRFKKSGQRRRFPQAVIAQAWRPGVSLDEPPEPAFYRNQATGMRPASVLSPRSR